LLLSRAGSKEELSETEKERKIRQLEARLRLLEGRPEEEFRSVLRSQPVFL
jgi:hypothetical protein